MKRLVGLPEVANLLKWQVVEYLIRQVLLEAPRQHHSQKGAAVGGAPAELATKTGQYLWPCCLKFGCYLDNALGRITQLGELLAEG